VARLLRVSADKVLGWIYSGELRAVNVAARRGGRPRWRIDVADLALFEQAREAVPEPAAARTPRRRGQAAGVIEYF
jgi:hypothetical protein